MTIETRAETPEGGTPIVGADPIYLADPLLDATVRMLVELSAQVWVERERRLTLEALLESRGLLARADIEAFQPSAEQSAAFKAERARFIEDVFKELRRIPLEAASRMGR
jgi:GAF domain-containing protein